MHCHGDPCNGQSILLYTESQWQETRLIFFIFVALLIRGTKEAEGKGDREDINTTTPGRHSMNMSLLNVSTQSCLISERETLQKKQSLRDEENAWKMLQQF